MRSERTEVHATAIHLSVKLQTESALCPHCPQECRELHQHAVRGIRDLPVSGRACDLHVRIRRFWCPRCGLPVAEPGECVEPYRNDTTRDEGQIYALVRQHTMTDVGALEGGSDEVVEGIFLREAKRRIPMAPFHGLQRVGIAEIAERKGRNADDLVWYHPETGKPVDGLEGRPKVHRAAYLTGLPDEVRRGIHEVCIDLGRPSAQAVAEALPHATVVVDRCPVMRSVNQALKRLKNIRKKDVPEEAHACHDPLLKNHEDLTEKQRATWDAGYEAEPVLKRAHQLKEQIRAIFETVQTIDAARNQVQKWIGNAYKEGLFPTILTTMKTGLRSILNEFHHRTTNRHLS